MVKIEFSQHFISQEEALLIRDEQERMFALKCIAVGCLVIHEIKVSRSLIDFLVINPKRNDPIETAGTLVEVTRMSQKDQGKKFVIKKRNGKKRKVLNKTGERKARQIQSMQESGYRWAIMYGENLRKIKKNSNL